LANAALRVWTARIARSTGRVGHTPSVRAGTSRELGARAARVCASQRVLRSLNARSRMALIGGRILDDAGTRRVPNARATQGNQRRSRWSRPYGEGSVKSSAQHMPAQSLPISGCLVPFRRGDAALRTPPVPERQNSRFWMSATSRMAIVCSTPNGGSGSSAGDQPQPLSAAGWRAGHRGSACRLAGRFTAGC
jgi:hypothetical protein